MKPAARRRARECAVQALYSWQLSNNDIADVEYQFLAEQDVKDVDISYFRELLAGVAPFPDTCNSLKMDKNGKREAQLRDLARIETQIWPLGLERNSPRLIIFSLSGITPYSTCSHLFALPTDRSALTEHSHLHFRLCSLSPKWHRHGPSSLPLPSSYASSPPSPQAILCLRLTARAFRLLPAAAGILTRLYVGEEVLELS